MNDRFSLLGFELIVADLERSLAMFVDLLGFELHEHGGNDAVAGRIAVVTDGRFAITLLEPTTEGDAPILPDRTPRFSQLILGADGESIDEHIASIVEAGLAVTPTSRGFYVNPEAVAGVLGVETAIVVTSDA